MKQVHEGDERAKVKVEGHEGTGKPVVLRIVGQEQNIIATIDKISGVDSHGIQRVLVRATNARTKKKMRVYASSILAVQPLMKGEDDGH